MAEPEHVPLRLRYNYAGHCHELLWPAHYAILPGPLRDRHVSGMLLLDWNVVSEI